MLTLFLDYSFPSLGLSSHGLGAMDMKAKKILKMSSLLAKMHMDFGANKMIKDLHVALG